MNIEWSTPKELFNELDKEFGFDMDVCAQDWNAKCERYLDPETDGLKQSWSGTCWMNPPYGREIEHWIRKAYEESQRGATVVCLVPSRTDTAWFHDYCLKAELRWIRGRIWFTDKSGKTGRPRFGSVIVIFRPNHITTACRRTLRAAEAGVVHLGKRYVKRSRVYKLVGSE